MPETDTALERNCWKRDGRAPEEVFIDDLGTDVDRWAALAAGEPKLACELLGRRQKVLDAFGIDGLIGLYEAVANVASPVADNVRGLIRKRIYDFLMADADPAECLRISVKIEKKRILSREELKKVPACRRKRAIVSAIVLAAGVFLLLLLSASVIFLCS